MLKYIKDDLWEVLFGKSASGLEAFISTWTHSVTGQELREYVLYEINPSYVLKFTEGSDNYIFKFIGNIL